MIIIPIKSIKLFKDKASNIATNTHLPICSYIRFQYHKGICTLTKTNYHAFVIEQFDAEGKEDQDYMVLEKDLFAFVDHSSDDFLTIRKEKGKLLLVDGNSTAPCITTTDSFSELEVPDSEPIELSSSVIKNIKSASKMLANEKDETWRSFVFLGSKMVVGCDGFVALSIPCEIEDQIVFRKEVIASLPIVGAVYRKNKSYDFFESGRALYGFVKSEQKFFDMTKGIKIPEKEAFEIERAPMISFNDWAISVAHKPEFADAEWNYKDGGLSLVWRDTYSEKTGERRIKSTGGDYFKYLPMQMNKILKAIDEDVLTCFRGENNVCITNEKRTFISLIQQIV